MNGSVVVFGSTQSSIPGLLIGTGGPGYPYSDGTSQGMTLGVTDNAPLTPFASCDCGHSFTANEVCTLYGAQQVNGSDCFDVNAENVTINCNGHTLYGDGAAGTYGVYSDQSGTEIINCDISNFDSGIFLNGTANGTIAGDKVHDNLNYAVLLSGSHGATVANSTAASSNNYAVHLSSSAGNEIYNNTLESTSATAACCISAPAHLATPSTGTTSRPQADCTYVTHRAATTTTHP